MLSGTVATHDAPHRIVEMFRVRAPARPAHLHAVENPRTPRQQFFDLEWSLTR